MANKVLFRALVAVFIILSVFFIASAGWATTYYVDPYGNDTTGNGSQSTPWKSLSSACAKVTNFGDIIHINPGTYIDNAQCSLSPGVIIQGDSRSTVAITTSANPFIKAVSNVPSVNGNNEISGSTFIGNNSNKAISSKGRNNQKIHDNHFQDFEIWLYISGKDPIWITDCTGDETVTATFCDKNKMLSIFPASTDWATGAEIHHNMVTNAKLEAHTIAGAKIHHNTIDNTKQDRSGVGHTSLWWSAVDFSYNEIHMLSNKWGNIAVEVWEIQNDSKFHDNKIDGWVSLLKNTKGINTPYSYEISNNDFSSNIMNGGIDEALEVGFYVNNIRIYNNYFSNTGSNKTYKRGIGIWGTGPIKEILISNNVFYNIDGDGIEINSTLTTGGYLADVDNIYIYNNVFDNMAAGGSSAVLLANDGSSGDLDGVFFKNNIINNAAYGVNFGKDPATMSGNVYSHNVIHSTTGHVGPRGISTFTIGTTYEFAPEILASGDRWKNYYRPNGPTSNLIGRGTDVGLPYSGSGPYIGAYEYEYNVSPPTNLRVVP